ncbi:unnamed protein product, partial [Sphenostylis stenocarpa]
MENPNADNEKNTWKLEMGGRGRVCTQGQTGFGNLMAKARECGPPLMIGSSPMDSHFYHGGEPL